MQPTKVMIRTINLKKFNNTILKKMLEESAKKIVIQGCGSGTSLGPEIVDEDGNKDSIGVLCSMSKKHLERTWGLITDENQKPLVNHLINKYKLNVSTEVEYNRVVEFLQALQTAHDHAFIDVKECSDRMKLFLLEVDKIKEAL